MQTPLHLTFRHLDHSPSVEARVRDHVDRLERFHDRITACHVVIEAPAAHRNKGAPFDVRLDLIMPGGRIHISSERTEQQAHTDVYVALRDAFEAAKRALKYHARQLRETRRSH